jgi:hypothetical protein
MGCYLEGWVVAAPRPLGRAVELQHLSRERGPLTEAEAASLADAWTSARDLLPGVEGSQPTALQWKAMSEAERGVLRGRLRRDEEGDRMHPLPAGHTLGAEQNALGHYALPGWDQRRGLPQYTSFEHEDGRSRTSEEFKCATGQTVGDWDAANVPGLVKGGASRRRRASARTAAGARSSFAVRTGSSWGSTSSSGGRAGRLHGLMCQYFCHKC